jgi:threonine/homoserine/homoserine lactone efflux protein
MINEYINAVLLGFGLAFMVGPVFFSLIETSISKGARAAIIFDLGVILADSVFIVIAYFGSISFLERIQGDPRIFLVGGLLLITFGIFTILHKKTKKKVTDEELVIPEKNNYLTLFLKGFFLNFINFGVLAFWLTVVIAVTSSLQANGDKILEYFAVVMVTFFIVDLGKIMLAKQLKRKLTPNVLRKIRIGLGVFFIVFGLILATKRFLPPETMQKIDNVISRQVE